MVYKRAYRPRRRLRRRGFGLDVKLGKSVPFVGGSSLRLGTRSVKKIVKREIAAQAETKQFIWDYNQSNLLNNTIYTSAPIHYIPQALDDSGRDGRSIFLKHVRMQGTYQGNVDYVMRVLVYWCEYNPGMSPSPKPTVSDVTIGSTDLFLPTSNSLTRALINNKKGNRIICERFLHLKTDGTLNQVRNWSIDCPINTKIQYQTASIPAPLADKQLYMSVIVYQSGIQNGNPTSASLQLNGMVTFRDL